MELKESIIYSSMQIKFANLSFFVESLGRIENKLNLDRHNVFISLGNRIPMLHLYYRRNFSRYKQIRKRKTDFLEIISFVKNLYITLELVMFMK